MQHEDDVISLITCDHFPNLRSLVGAVTPPICSAGEFTCTTILSYPANYLDCIPPVGTNFTLLRFNIHDEK